MSNENQKQMWMEEALALVPERYGRDEWREYFAPMLGRCNSKSRHTFWQWLRLTLAKSSDTSWLLDLMQESRISPEAEPKSADGFEYVVNGDTALIKVGDEKAHAIWRIPVAHLDWAKEQFPVWLRRLPDLEPPELARQREIKHQLRYLSRYLTDEQKTSLRKEVDDLSSQVDKAYTPVPRYCLMRSAGGRDTPVHRLFVNAGDDDEVGAINGDFLDYTTTKVKVTLEPVPDKDGIAGGRGESETRIVEVSNLQIVPMSEAKQADFEKSLLQYKITLQGDISETPLKVMVNWDLGKRTGVYGQIMDCGESAPLKRSEEYSPERFEGMPIKTLTPDTPRQGLNVDALRRKWRGF
jgi:hypothetical protein